MSSESTSLSRQSSGVSTPISEEFLELFNPESDVSIELYIPENSLTFIDQYQSSNNSPFREIYVPANITISVNGKVTSFENIGIRMKGNTSRHQVYSYGSSLTPVHFKLSFKATFDGEEYDLPETTQFKKAWEDPKERKERKNRNFCGLEKLDLKYVPRNEYDGRTVCLAREIYCFDAFRKAGVHAPYASLCSLRFGDGTSSYEGSYELSEPIDKEFLKKRYSKEDAKGDLYKCVYNGMGPADLTRNGAIDKSTGERLPNGKIGVEDDYHYYEPCYQLKTNDDEGENSDFSKMANFIASMWELVWNQGAESILNAILDYDEFARFSALSYLLGNFDDQRYNANNYYVYFVPSTGKAVYFPYDWDWSLGLGSEKIYNVTSFGPFDQSQMVDNVPNIYYATFYKNKPQALSYDTSTYEDLYYDYVDSFREETLSIASYQSLRERLGCGNEESNQVESYMEAKLLSSKLS